MSYTICKECGNKKRVVKEPELMTLQEAVQKMDFGDSFKMGQGGGEILTMVHHEDDSDMKAFKSDQHDDYAIIEPDALLTMGQIIPVEPKVLTAFKFIEEYFKLATDKTIFDTKEAVEIFKGGDQNGQVKQWKNHSNIREAAEGILKAFIRKEILETRNCEGYFDSLHKALKNLKTLKAE